LLICIISFNVTYIELLRLVINILLEKCTMMSSTLCFWTAQFLILDCTNCILDCTNWLDCTLRISPDFLGGNDASSKTTGQDESVRTHHTITLYLHAAALPSANDKSASSQKCLAQKCNKWLSRQQTVMPVKVKEVRRMTFSAV